MDKARGKSGKETTCEVYIEDTLREFKLPTGLWRKAISKASAYVKKIIFRKSFQDTHLRGTFDQYPYTFF